MKIYDLIKLSAANLWKRKLRTFLTLLGVAIGTTSIVVMVSIGVGLQASEEEQIASYMDVTVIEVYKSWGDANATKLDAKTVANINEIDHVKAASPYMSEYISTGDWSEYVISGGRYKYNGQLIVVDIDMMEELGYELEKGSWPEKGQSDVILFSANGPYNFLDPNKENAYAEMYNADGTQKPYPIDPLTRRIVANAQYNQTDDEGNIKPYNGEIKQYKISSPGIVKQNINTDYGQGVAYIDYDFYITLKQQYAKLNGKKMTADDKEYSQIKVKCDDYKNVAEVEKKLEEMGFETYSAQKQLEQMSGMMKTIELVLGALGAVSMLVAAIGIANTMIMSIYERTKEIGVMKVIGCKLGDIRSMFLMEAAGIGLCGGVLGLTTSHILSVVVNVVMARAMGQTSAISRIPIWLDLLGFAFSILVGVLSGISPANRAVKISALSAIRTE